MNRTPPLAPHWSRNSTRMCNNVLITTVLASRSLGTPPLYRWATALNTRLVQTPTPQTSPRRASNLPAPVRVLVQSSQAASAGGCLVQRAPAEQPSPRSPAKEWRVLLNNIVCLLRSCHGKFKLISQLFASLMNDEVQLGHERERERERERQRERRPT